MGTGAPADTSRARVRPRRSRALIACAVVGVVAAIALRLVALRSDPYPGLDWSAGLLTDEGFYVHNARNVALYGHARTDEFNNMLLAPLLHAVQVAVFETAGFGSAQARAVSVACGLLSLGVLWAALRRGFDNRVAVTAVLLLGLDHTYLLYNRMALMDTPAALGAALAFYAFVRGVHADPERTGGRASIAWLAGCGALLGLTVANRALCVYLLPAPFVALWGVRAGGRMRAVAAGLAAVCALYGALWYLPNRAELDRMSRSYRVEQLQPTSAWGAARNAQHAVFGDRRGLAPYLFRHTPVAFGLVLVGLATGVGAWGRRRVVGAAARGACPLTRYLVAWLLAGWALLAVVNYSPSRYYVTTYPAFFALAGLGLWRWPDVRSSLWGPGRRWRCLRAALVWFAVYHAAETVVHHGGVIPLAATAALLYGAPTAAALAALWRRPAGRAHALSRAPVPVVWALAAWLVVNAGWLGHWWAGLDHRQYAASVWLGRHLGADSVLLGDIAPGLCLDNRLLPVHVSPGLCNDRQPVERFAGRPRYIAIIVPDTTIPVVGKRYWLRHYPALVAPQRLWRGFHIVKWDVGVYPVPAS